MNTSGILTMCYEADWHKAIGLSLCLRARETELPTAVVAPQSLRKKLDPYFDHFIPERTDLKGFSHKVHLDEYSPFEKTLFIDADILVFRDLQELFVHWNGYAYMARGELLQNSTSAFGLKRGKILTRLNKRRFSCIGGAGHAYFEKPACEPIFKRAREILLEYDQWAPGAKIADEDILGIVMTENGIQPDDRNDITAFAGPHIRHKIYMDAIKGECQIVSELKKTIHPIMLHFHTRSLPFTYHSQLSKLASKYEVTNINWRLIGFREWLHFHFWWGIKKKARTAKTTLIK